MLRDIRTSANEDMTAPRGALVLTGASFEKDIPKLLHRLGTQGSGTGVKLNTCAYRENAKERGDFYNFSLHKSNSPYTATSQSRKRGNFKCRYCGRFFVYLTPFIAHEEAHTNEKRFRCYFCPEAFVTRQLLTIHLRIHKDEILGDNDNAP
nr:zinc finger protein 791-like isoform X2 [Dermacentor andersoni]